MKTRFLSFKIMSLSLLLSCSLFPKQSLAALDLRILHTRPECNHPGKTSAWCDLNDTDAGDDHSGMVEEISSFIDLANNPESKIYIAYYSFSNKKVFRKLCEKGKQGIPIEGFFDYDYAGEGMLPAQLYNECQGPSGKNVKMRFLGIKKKDENGELLKWRLHHNKFLVVRPGNGEDVSVSFSSGNLSTFGTSLHFDHWVTTMAPEDSQYVKSHLCVVKGLRAAYDKSSQKRDDSYIKLDDPSLYIKSLNDCYYENDLSPQKAMSEDGIYLLTAPNNYAETEKALLQEIDNIGRVALKNPDEKYEIFGAIQHFTHYTIASRLNSLCRRTNGRVAVNFIMDDDVVLAKSEVPGVSEFFESNLKNTQYGGKSCINTSFMQTNNEIMQMMHNKFIIFTGPNYARSFSGAGHFTYSAMRDNYENFYVTKNSSLVSQYKELFDYMRKSSMRYDHINTQEWVKKSEKPKEKLPQFAPKKEFKIEKEDW